MSRSAISPYWRERLIRQLVYLDENKYDLEKSWIAEPSMEKNEWISFIRKYEERIESLVAGEYRDGIDSCVYIGSRVRVRFDEDGDQELFTVVFPEEVRLEHNCISFMSPLGMGLVFARQNETVLIRSPQGTYTVTILEHQHEEEHHIDPG
ncbi:GreA/GreB family elongation factor [Cohnella sp. 56]|uniref:GreA/GreB family elongation factor n=1 Tax=Cohnella sp. 56 TaxID=3113722 RepID=UPI0030E770CB